MKHTTENEANARAEMVREKFDLKGWAVRVWQNMGWHWNLQKGPISLSEYTLSFHGGTYFSALISDEPERPGTGLSAWSPEKGVFPKTPQEAIALSLAAVNEYVDHLQTARKAANEAAATAGVNLEGRPTPPREEVVGSVPGAERKIPLSWKGGAS
jgi:hypothetical protein